MIFNLKIMDVVGAFGKLILLALIIGPCFWFFLTQLAEHGWK